MNAKNETVQVASYVKSASVINSVRSLENLVWTRLNGPRFPFKKNVIRFTFTRNELCKTEYYINLVPVHRAIVKPSLNLKPFFSCAIDLEVFVSNPLCLFSRSHLAYRLDSLILAALADDLDVDSVAGRTPPLRIVRLLFGVFCFFKFAVLALQSLALLPYPRCQTFLFTGVQCVSADPRPLRFRGYTQSARSQSYNAYSEISDFFCHLYSGRCSPFLLGYKIVLLVSSRFNTPQLAAES
jgi:hypothetical protein